MKVNLTVRTPMARTVHIFHPNDRTLAIRFEDENLDPSRRSHVEDYLFDEGFFDEASGRLLPSVEREVVEELIASVEANAE